MSVYTDDDVTVECDKCYTSLSDYDSVYCGACAGVHDDEHFDTVYAQAVEIVKDWFDDNTLILSDKQQAFGQVMLDSVERGRLPDLKELRK